jgi:chromosome segregation ATPase
MSLLEIITKISFCLLVAALLGFIIGWLFSKLQKEEKIERKYNALYDDYEVKVSEIKQLKEELALKEEHTQKLLEQYQQCEKERMSAQMEETNCDQYLRQIKELESENEMLIAQIREQKLCEDENSLLKDEIRVLEDEKEVLLDKLENCKESEENYKSLIGELEALKAQNEKLRQEAAAKERIFSLSEAYPQEEDLDTIKQSVLKLKEEVAKIKDERRALKSEVKKLRKKLSEKKAALKRCREQLDLKEAGDDTDSYEETVSLPDDEKDTIKSLSELIRDTLDDLHK